MNGLAGAPDDWATWATWTAKLNDLAPWWSFLLLSALVVAVIWGPPFLARHGPAWMRWKSPEIDDAETAFDKLQAQLTEAQGQKATAERARDEALADARRLAEKIAELEGVIKAKTLELEMSQRAALENHRAAEDLKERLGKATAELAEYRSREPSPPEPLTPTESVAIDDLRVLFNTVGRPAWANAFDLLVAAQSQLRSHTPLALLLSPIIDESRSATAKLAVDLEATGECDFPAVMLTYVGFFKAYMKVVRWLHLSASEPRFRVDTFEPYEKWKALHAEFQSVSERTFYRTDLGIIRGHIDGIGWVDRYRDDPGNGFNESKIKPSGGHTEERRRPQDES